MSNIQLKTDGIMPREIAVDDDIILRFLKPDDAEWIFEILVNDVNWDYKSGVLSE